MSNHKSNLSKPPIGQDTWLTKQQAAAQLQVAEKTIDRMAKAGELQKQTFKRAGQVPIVVFHPGDVERARVARAPQAFIVPETGGHMSAVSGHPVRDMSTRMSELSVVPVRRLWLTLQQAADYSGLPTAVLLEFIGAGRLPALDVGRRRGGRWRIRQIDLRQLDARPSDLRGMLTSSATAV